LLNIKHVGFVFWLDELEPKDAYNRALENIGKKYKSFDVIQARLDYVMKGVRTNYGDHIWRIKIEVTDED